ncbi:hypothetical protein RMCBS344292_09106 [Rhizopus microsporus]|nr:hypothetical protein RMCBS344292_09106 [Rhizopus microsporus]
MSQSQRTFVFRNTFAASVSSLDIDEQTTHERSVTPTNNNGSTNREETNTTPLAGSSTQSTPTSAEADAYKQTMLNGRDSQVTFATALSKGMISHPHWTVSETKSLIEAVTRFYSRMVQARTNNMLGSVWEDVLYEFNLGKPFRRSRRACQDKWHQLVKQYKDADEQRARDGSCSFLYYDEMHRVLSRETPAVNPMFTSFSIGHQEQQQQQQQQQESPQPVQEQHQRSPQPHQLPPQTQQLLPQMQQSPTQQLPPQQLPPQQQPHQQPHQPQTSQPPPPLQQHQQQQHQHQQEQASQGAPLTHLQQNRQIQPPNAPPVQQEHQQIPTTTLQASRIINNTSLPPEQSVQPISSRLTQQQAVPNVIYNHDDSTRPDMVEGRPIIKKRRTNTTEELLENLLLKQEELISVIREQTELQRQFQVQKRQQHQELISLLTHLVDKIPSDEMK